MEDLLLPIRRDDVDRPLIIGGGHTGLLLALALDRHGLAPTVVDSAPAARVLDAPFDGRALALMQGSRQVFETLGLWPAFAAVAAPVRSVEVRDMSTGAVIVYDAAQVGETAFGYGMETRLLHRRLLELVRARPAIRHVAPARLIGLTRRADRITARLADGRSIDTRLVIGADGRRSAVRDLAGIGCRSWTYPQTAITFAFRHRRPHDDRVREYMRPVGPLALLPIGADICSATWIERPETAEQLLSETPAALLAALRARQDNALDPIDIQGDPTGFPLGALIAHRYAAPRIALVGDAAHGTHPIHAQGWNLGVRDIAALAETLVDAKRAGQDLGASEVLQGYARRREGDARLILGLTDGLNRLFSTDLAPARLLRRAGLMLLDSMPPVKAWVMRRGMGLAGDLPKLARGQGL